MKKITQLSLFIAVLMMSACRMASFTGKPGVELKQYPESVLGTYRYIESKDGISDTSTLWVKADEIVFKSTSFSFDILRSDSSYSLSHLGDFHYLNCAERDSSGKTSYAIFPFEYNSKYLYIYKINLSSKNLKRMKKCGLKPAAKQGEFVMEDKAFKKFVEKYMKRKEAIKFVKIN